VSQATEPVGVAAEPPLAGERPAPTSRTYQPRASGTWWLRNRRYLFYVIRELTSIPIAAWVMVYLVQVLRLQNGSAGYHPLSGPGWVAFSAVCLVFALWHSVTFLSLAGRIIRVPVGERYLPARAIVTGMFGLFVAVSIVIGFLVVFGGR
jgi:fumarate reductase subunit C